MEELSIQVEGYLAIQDSVVPAVVMDTKKAVFDVTAVVREAPVGGPIVMHLQRDAATYCVLTIPDGQTSSNAVSGFGIAPLNIGTQLTVNITSVPSASGTLPGRDLTVTVRL